MRTKENTGVVDDSRRFWSVTIEMTAFVEHNRWGADRQGVGTLSRHAALPPQFDRRISRPLEGFRSR